MISATKVGESNFVLVMGGLGSSVVGLRVTKPVWTIVAIMDAVGIAFSGASDRFLDLLLVAATVVPPFAGVLTAYASVLAHQSAPQMLRTAPNIRSSAVAAWLGSAWAAWVVDSLVRANFLLMASGVCAFAVGVDRSLGTTVGTILLVIFGLGLAVAGVFVPDAVRGYPPGAPTQPSAKPTRQHRVHSVVGGPIAFFARSSGHV